MAISKRLRYEVLRRDNHTCRYCGATAPDATITIDHVVPVALGGTDASENLVSACKDCNAGKSASNPAAPLIADVAQKVIRWERAKHLAAEIALRDRTAIDAQVQVVLDHWFSDIAFGAVQSALPPADARNSIAGWLARGLDVRILTDMIDVTVARYHRDQSFPVWQCWKYFAGCCWTSLRDLEARAQQLIDGGQV